MAKWRMYNPRRSFFVFFVLRTFDAYTTAYEHYLVDFKTSLKSISLRKYSIVFTSFRPKTLIHHPMVCASFPFKNEFSHQFIYLSVQCSLLCCRRGNSSSKCFVCEFDFGVDASVCPLFNVYSNFMFFPPDSIKKLIKWRLMACFSDLLNECF